MSEHTQTLDPKEQNRMRFIRTDRKQDHGTRDMDTFEHAMRKESSESSGRRKAFLDRKFGEEAIRDALAAATSPAELESHADQLLLEAGDIDLAHSTESERFQIPITTLETEDDEEEVEVHHRSSGRLYAGEEDLYREFASRTDKYKDAERVYNGDNGDGETDDYLDGFGVKDRP